MVKTETPKHFKRDGLEMVNTSQDRLHLQELFYESTLNV